MNITILTGSVPSATFIDAQINAIAENDFSITVIGKKAGAFTYAGNTRVVVVPERIVARLLFIAKMLLATRFKNFFKITGDSNGIVNLYNNLLFYLPIIYSRPDKIHIQWAAFVHNHELLFELFPGKIVVSLRGAHINYTPVTTPEIKKSYMRLFPKVHRFHAVSKAIAAEAGKYGAQQANTEVIYSFVSDALLEKEIKPKPAGKRLQIISVGRFFWKKGYDYALDALSLLQQRGIPFTYTLIAEGKTPASIIYHIHQAGVSDNVRIVNGLPHPQVLKEIENNDVLLLPSVEEGIANVTLEAMAVGTPVITTDVGGMREVIENKVSGFIVPPRDIQSIANALTSVAAMDKDQRFAVAVAAKKILKRQHARQMFVEYFSRFYNY